MKELIKVCLLFVAIGFLLSESIYWFRLGEGKSWIEKDKISIANSRAQEIGPKFGLSYSDSKEYVLENDYEVTRTRAEFPFFKTDTTSKVRQYLIAQ